MPANRAVDPNARHARPHLSRLRRLRRQTTQAQIMQNIQQQKYGAMEVAAAAPPKKKLGRTVVVALAALSLAGVAALSLAPKTAGGVATSLAMKLATPVSCAAVNQKLQAPPTGPDGIKYARNVLETCGVTKNGALIFNEDSPAYHCPICIHRLAQATAGGNAPRNACAAASALVSAIDVDDVHNEQHWLTANLAICSMTTGVHWHPLAQQPFINCPGCSGHPLPAADKGLYTAPGNTSPYTIPCVACTMALDTSKALFNDNKLVNAACCAACNKQCAPLKPPAPPAKKPAPAKAPPAPKKEAVPPPKPK